MIHRLPEAPLIASVQADSDSPLCSPDMLLALAQACAQPGVGALRLQGTANIRKIEGEISQPIIGLIKREYPESEVYITPTMGEVRSLLETTADVIALDGTARPRPDGVSLKALIDEVHSAGRLAMADCDCADSVRHSLAAGADLIGTTLAGYTSARARTAGPDIEFLRQAVDISTVPVIAEGRVGTPQEAAMARRIGAAAVVVGTALNDPWKRTREFAAATDPARTSVGAVDIGGTWLRFAVFSRHWELQTLDKVPLPSDPNERLAWIRRQAESARVGRLGVSSGGTIDPASGIVTEAKPIIPDHVGTEFSERTLGLPTLALNDGLATAWGHACLPAYAGLRTAVLALGTGVGCGLVDRHRIWMGPGGAYPRLNDLGIEESLGGAALQGKGSQQAQEAAERALQTVRAMWHPSRVVLSGAVGLSDWLHLPDCDRSPFGENAGLYGAAALALFPPEI